MEGQNNSNIQKKVLKINLKVFIIIAIAVVIVTIAVIGLVIRNKRIGEKRKAAELEKERKRVSEILKNSSNKIENDSNIEKKDFKPNKEENKTATTVEEYIMQIYPLKSTKAMSFPEFNSIQFANKEWLWSVAMYNSERCRQRSMGCY